MRGTQAIIEILAAEGVPSSFRRCISWIEVVLFVANRPSTVNIDDLMVHYFRK